MPSDHNLVLTGFMGTGKTTVGRELARTLDMDFIDTDEVIETQNGPITQIFTDRGEADFRSIETAVAREIGQTTGQVIATGGRTMLDAENFRELGRRSRIFCLEASADEIHQRVAHDTTRVDRPLLLDQDPKQRIAELLSERGDLYARFPRVRTEGRDPGVISSEIAGLWASETTFEISTPSGTFPYTLGVGGLHAIREFVSIEGPVVLLTDDVAGGRYGPNLGDVDFTISFSPDSIPVTVDSVEPIIQQLRDANIDRSATVISLGGALIASTARLVAARLDQDAQLIHCPTRLTAMVDSSIGGERAANSSQGSYQPPSAVLADVGTLQSLSGIDFVEELADLADRELIDDGWDREGMTADVLELDEPRQPMSLTDLLSLATEAVRARFGVSNGE